MDRLSTKGQAVDQIDLRDVPHSAFDRSNHNYFTGKLGALIPTRFDECYPGDRVKGTPRLVANFEPLVAPLMGSMVLKQESFFVPYIQLWRHAWKFFSGKNGFNTPMPSMSPSDVFTGFYDNVFVRIFGNVGSNVDADRENFGALVHSLFNYHNSVITHGLSPYEDSSDSGATIDYDFEQIIVDVETVLRAVYSSRKMLDLVIPALNIFKEYFKSADFKYYIDRFTDPTSYYQSSERLKLADDILIFGTKMGDLLNKFFNFFLGPSSIFDYLGWFVPDTRVTPPVSDSTTKNYINNVFSRVFYNNINIHGSEKLEDVLLSYFSDVVYNFLPFKAYYLVWYWNYRDQLLETDILDPEEDEFLGDTITDNVFLYITVLRQRCWFKDAFTTALTNTGDGNLLVPVSAPDGYEVSYEFYDAEDRLINTKDAANAYNSGATVASVILNDGTKYKVPMNYLSGASYGISSSDNSSSYVSLDLFDRIKRLRSFIQKRLILGYEVDDVIWSSFMVKMSNVRMHVPELLGRGRDSVQMNTIVNNTSTSEQIAGDKTATAYVDGSSSVVNYFCDDWGFYFQIATIMPIQSYSRGLSRFYLKRERYDFMWPEFATMGMDAVYNVELGSSLAEEDALTVFGYQGRYYDLKYRQDEEHGRLLTDLNYLTFSREFNNDNLPKLNYMFVHCWPRLDGFVMSDPLEDVFRADCYTAQGWERRLPVPSEIVG